MCSFRAITASFHRFISPDGFFCLFFCHFFCFFFFFGSSFFFDITTKHINEVTATSCPIQARPTQLSNLGVDENYIYTSNQYFVLIATTIKYFNSSFLYLNDLFCSSTPRHQHPKFSQPFFCFLIDDIRTQTIVFFELMISFKFV